MAILLIHRSEEETQVIELENDRVTLGRREGNDIIIDDVFVSRTHAELQRRGDLYVIRDRKSKFGTFINGERITEAKLNYGDEIQLGNTLITFVDDKAIDQIIEHKTPTRRLGAVLSLGEKIDAVKEQIAQKDAPERIVRSLDEVKASFTVYQQQLSEAEKSREIASTLCEVGKMINFVFDLNVLLHLLMDSALKILQARRGFIMLYDQTTESLKVKVARNMGGELDPNKPAGISQTIAWQTFTQGMPVTTRNATEDERFRAQESVISYAIGSVISVPLVAKEKGTIGVIYLDNTVDKKRFDDRDIEFMTSFAPQAAIAIENAQLYEKIKKEEKIRDRLQRFFSPSVVKKIMTEEGAVTLGGENRVATILFCDIRGYTSLTEKIDTLVAVGILNDFLSSMTEEVFIHEGTLDKYIGDCVMAIFGAPVAHSDDPLRAVKAALGMKLRVQELKQKWHEELHLTEVESFEIGIGIHTGEVIAGNVGNLKRMEYTVVSTAVNLASRLESVADPGQILISDETYKQVDKHIQVNILPPVKLRHISRPVTVYEVLRIST